MYILIENYIGKNKEDFQLKKTCFAAKLLKNGCVKSTIRKFIGFFLFLRREGIFGLNSSMTG